MLEQKYSEEEFREIMKNISKIYRIPEELLKPKLKPKMNYSKKIIEIFLYFINIILSAFAIYMFLTSYNEIIMIGSAFYLVAISNILLLTFHFKTTQISSWDFFPYSLIIIFVSLLGLKALYIYTTI